MHMLSVAIDLHSLTCTVRNGFAWSVDHSNMGNTGSFMIRSGPWKYIAFGRYTYDKTYRPQLFNVEADPEELTDLAGGLPAGATNHWRGGGSVFAVGWLSESQP